MADVTDRGEGDESDDQCDEGQPARQAQAGVSTYIVVDTSSNALQLERLKLILSQAFREAQARPPLFDSYTSEAKARQPLRQMFDQALADQFKARQVVPQEQALQLEPLRQVVHRAAALQWQAIPTSFNQVRLSDVADYIAEVKSADIFIAPNARADDGEFEEVEQWLRKLLSGLLRFGGPVLVMQVLFITWRVAADVSVDARQQISELAGLIALALALAPFFRDVGNKLERRDRDE